MAKMETQRVAINVPIELLGRLDDYASRMNINRTSAVCVLLNQALDNQKAIKDIGELLNLYKGEIKG